MEKSVLFWTAFGTIGTILGAIATTFAVIVALWQTKYSTKKKLKLIFNDNIKVYDNKTLKLLNEYVGITIINVGNRDVNITDWSMVIDKRRIKIITQLQGVLKIELPKKIEIENTLDLNYEKDLFLKTIKDILEKMSN